MSAADDRPRLALSPGHGAPAEREGRGSGSGDVSNVAAAARSRAHAIDWRRIAPYLLEDEERREKAREDQASGASA